MVIRQKKFGTGKLVEINSYEGRHGELFYSVELREDAKDWMMFWEIREDGTHITAQRFVDLVAKTFKITPQITQKDNQLSRTKHTFFVTIDNDEYTRKAREDG